MPRRIIAAVDVTIPPPKGSEEEKKWRGVAYESGTIEYYEGDEYFDWNLVDKIPEPVKVCLDFMLAWRALEEPDDYPLPDE